MGGRALLAANDEVVKTIFNNGWKSGCSWWAHGASNISEIEGDGINKGKGLCTTFPDTGVRIPHLPLPCCCVQSCKVHRCTDAQMLYLQARAVLYVS